MTMKNSNKSNRRKLALTIMLVAAAVGALIALIVFVNVFPVPQGAPAPHVSPTSVSQEVVAPKVVEKEIVMQDLTGKWTTKINETTFNVDVQDSTITIKMVKNGSTLLYWYGTFPSTGIVGETITSAKKDIQKAVLSGADSKTFQVKQRTLTFDVSAMGQTRAVEVTHV